MNIVALYKVWSGEEWLSASVESILPFVSKVLLLTSNISWIGGRGNPSIPAINSLCEKYPHKIIHYNTDEPNQLVHCMHGFRYIKAHHPCDFIQLIDSDELWDGADYQRAIDFLQKYPNYPAYRTHMYTYIKSPYYRIDPPEPLKPVCFINPNMRDDMGMEPRGCAIKPFVIMPDVWCHHYVFVRSHFNKVLEKLIQSHVSEKQPYERMDRWIPEVWNKLPDWNRGLFPNGMHPAIGFGHHWRQLIKIGFNELPEVLRNKAYEYILSFGGD